MLELVPEELLTEARVPPTHEKKKVDWQDLPNELTLAIWEYSLAPPTAPRLIHLTPKKSSRLLEIKPLVRSRVTTEDETTMPGVRWKKQVYRPPGWQTHREGYAASDCRFETWTQAQALVPPPAQIAICRQSRQVLSKVYGQKLADPSTGEPTVWFLPQDTLYLSWPVLDKLIRNRATAKDLGIEVERVERLALDKCPSSTMRGGPCRGYLSRFNRRTMSRLDDIRWMFRVIRWFPNLKLVTFVAKYYEPQDCSNLVMMDLMDIPRLLRIYKNGYRLPFESRMDKVEDESLPWAADELEGLRDLFSRQRDWEITAGVRPQSKNWVIPKIELGLITTLQRKTEFEAARDAFYMQKRRYSMIVVLASPHFPLRIGFFVKQNSLIRHALRDFLLYVKDDLQTANIAYLRCNNKPQPLNRRILDIPFLKNGGTLMAIVA
ncbi:uncharacterized protein L3040_008398 [Drepanopeziza brunnea f. sp. 'multigermtubi']|uniref:2EXR domain-containing protein n=1 Tax=Marssonina brunnea f. sp. multigermtubi (strain MB_m1) TaxID=1072389 RepID=K1XX58_MARBU|nr:uncharacterized protein MBM_04220 [Drepanopeziza brunnea f. sp. 'multigermtubi' MB_m1]EKD17359.1 hypothetical protein MBM_04220 [Drepanopeziza brunnea f. sp. 'multigermtubi' MB_m1]KAJ5035140.1 hypothetical protein L3040_008398 [Drepanopeziza brunnea f. sp. 'multigermtubi']